MHGTQFVERHLELVLHGHRVGTLIDDTDTRPRHLSGGEHRGEPRLLGPRHRDQHTSRRFGEQPHKRISVFGKQDAATGFAGQGGLDDRLRKSALGQVVRGVDQPVAGGGGLQRLAQVDCRNLQRFAIFRHGTPCDHEALFRQQFGYAAV